MRALSASGQVEIVAEAEDGRSALAEIKQHQPDVALLDYKLPELDGVAVTHAVVRDQIPTRVLLVSAFTDSGVVYKALETGAAGFVSKESRREQIVDAVLACSRGENVVPPGRRLRAGFRDPAPQARRHAGVDAARARDPAPDRRGQEPARDREGALPRAHDGEDPCAAPLREARRPDRAAAVASAMRRGLIE